MKKLSQVLAISALVLTGLVASASAQSNATSTKIKVDFDFSVSNQEFPAGEYRIKIFNDTHSQKLLLVQRLDVKGQAIVASAPNQNRGHFAPGDVTFTKYGDKYFLASVQLGDDVVHQISRSRTERNVQRMSIKVTTAQAKQIIVPTTGQ